MRIVFFGTSDFATPTLRRLAADGHELQAVVTQPARPRGRGRKLSPGPVEQAARALGIAVMTPAEPNAPEFVARFAALKPELGVLAAYGRILSQALLDVPGHGFVNLHPSLLPAYRGAAPIQRALIDGRTETGITVIRMKREVDAGDILKQQSFAIDPDETAGELSCRLAAAGAELVSLAIREPGRLRPVEQDPSKATGAPKITDEERLVDWRRPAAELHNLIRGLSPEPAAYTFFRSKHVQLLRSALTRYPSPAEPGTILTVHPGLLVATGSAALELRTVKPESGPAQSGRSFRNGHRPAPGEKFENP